MKRVEKKGGDTINTHPFMRHDDEVKRAHDLIRVRAWTRREGSQVSMQG